MTYDCDQFYSDSMLDIFQDLNDDQPYNMLTERGYAINAQANNQNTNLDQKFRDMVTNRSMPIHPNKEDAKKLLQHLRNLKRLTGVA